jgi:hypothetical protein
VNMKEGEDVPSEDDELSLNKKRTREEKEAEDRVRSAFDVFITLFKSDWNVSHTH